MVAFLSEPDGKKPLNKSYACNIVHLCPVILLPSPDMMYFLPQHFRSNKGDAVLRDMKPLILLGRQRDDFGEATGGIQMH